MLKDKYSFVADIESTGFCPIRNDIITLGCYVVDDKLKVIDHIYLKFKPDFFKWMNEDNVATHIHKITLEEMAFHPERRESVIKLMQFMKKYICPSHNTRPLFFHATQNFDYQFLEWLFRKEDLQYSLWKILGIDKAYSTVLLGRSLGYEGNKLNEWAVRMGEVNFNHHNALDDALMCVKILQYILKNNFNNSVDKLFLHLEKMKDDDLQKMQSKQDRGNVFDL